MNDFIIALQAGIDKAKSAESINKNDIAKLQKKLDALKLQATIGEEPLKEIAAQLEKITGQKISVSNIGIDTRQAGKDGQKYGEAFKDGASGSINADVANQIDKISDASTATIINNEKKKQEAAQESLRLQSESASFHANLKEAGIAAITENTDKVILEEEKLANAMADVHEKSEQIRQSEEKRQQIVQNLKDQFTKAYHSLTQWLSVSSIVTRLISQLQKMPQAVYEIDTAMTNLYKATDETESKYVRFLDSASTSAQKLGRSVSSIVDQTANWAKLGFSIDEASKLAEISSVYANVGEVDDDTAISDIVTAMKAFHIEAENSITIVDSLNKLGNEFATDAKSLGQGLRNAASSMAAAGNDINQTLAILTGGGEITQDAAELSNALRVVSMRLRGMKDELQEIGEEYEDIESIRKIQTQIYDLTNKSVNIFNDDGTFKSTYEQLKEISEIYFDLNDSDRADLTEIMFGKNRASQGTAILQAFQSGQIQKAYEASVHSAGSAYEEQEKRMASLEAKTRQFEAAFQSLSQTIVDSHLLKDITDLGTAGVSALEGLAKIIGGINAIGGGSTFGSIGAVSGLLMNKNGIGKRILFQW